MSRQHREAKAPRPPPLKLISSSSKIKKTRAGAAPLAAAGSLAPTPPVSVRRPVIIHTYSPKVIKADSDNFMWLVQKLTGSSDTRLRCKKSRPHSSSLSTSLLDQQQEQQEQSVTRRRVSDDDSAEDFPEEKTAVQPSSSAPRLGSLAEAPLPSPSSNLWSPLPTPNFVLQQEFLKELPMFSPVFSPATQQLASWALRH